MSRAISISPREAGADQADVRPHEGAPSAGDVSLPWTNFYWAIIEPSREGATIPAANDAELLDFLQAEVPVPVEELQVAWTPIPTGRLLACAMPVPMLEDFVQRREGKATGLFDGEALRLGPSQLPPLLQTEAAGADVQSINLLCGKFTPASVKGLRRRSRWWALAYACAALALVGAGFHSLDHQAQRELESLRDRAREVVAEAGFGQRPGVDAAKVLVAATANVRRARGPQAIAVVPGDAATALTVLLSHWPQRVESRTSRLSVTGRAVTLSVQVSDEAQAQAIGTALSACEGWTLEPPRTQRASAGLTLSATLKKAVASEGKQ